MDKATKTFLFVSLFVGLVATAQTGLTPRISDPKHTHQDSTIPHRPIAADSLLPILKKDSLVNPKVDSLTQVEADSLQQTKKKKTMLSSVVNYESADSMTFMGNNIAMLYGQGKINYEDIQLDANYIRMRMDSSLVYAVGTPDSTGKKMLGEPIFKQGEDEYKSQTLNYNFNTQKGYITNVVSQQGEGYVVGGTTKKLKDNSFFMQGCKYTTCDHHDHPHFYLNITKAKVHPGKNIISGPAYMVIEDVPLPLALPFAYFPFTDSYSSGIIMPTFGDEMERGFFMRNGGYYFAISDYIDLAATGEIYTKGSWGIDLTSSYRKRYKFSGNFNLGYMVTITGDKGLPDYSKSKDFRLIMSHTQDPKSNPNLTLSASINFSTSSYDRNNMGSIYNPNLYTQNTKSSSVNLSYRIPNSVWSFSTSMNISQRSQDSTLSVTFPDLNITMSRLYPFKRKQAVGSERWYEKIALSYTGTLRNSVTTREDKFFQANLIKDWKNGMQHNIPVSATFNLFKYINITPSFNYTERWYTNKVMQDWDTQKSAVRNDTVWGFNRVYNYNMSVSASTKLYGFYKPLPFLGDKVQMIRHVFTPSVSFSAAPDFGNPSYGFWNQYSYTDSKGEVVTRDYSPFSGGMFGTAPRGRQGVISFSMSNNIEMKIKSKRDTSGVRKISLIDNLSAGISYNMAADSMNWSNISPSLRLKLSDNFTLNLQGTFDVYTYQLDKNDRPVRVNQTRWQKYGFPHLGRLSSTGTSFSYTFNNETVKKLFSGEAIKEKIGTPKKEEETEDDDLLEGEESLNQPKKPKEEKAEIDSDGFLRFKFPWSFAVNYSMSLGYGEFNKQKLEYDYKLTHNLSFNGNLNLGKGWAFNFSSSYDFDMKKLAYMNCNISRDLHCWKMTAGFVPVGPYKSYYFTLSASAALLQDLKYDKRSSPYDATKWY